MTADAASAPPLVAAVGLVVRFDGQTALDRVDIAVRRREIVTVVGPNGSGKTTLVRVLLGLLAPAEGAVECAAGLRVGYVPQHLHVDATLPITVRRFMTLGARAQSAQVASALAQVGAAGLMEAPLHALSGGEMRRVVLARALLRRPDLLVLDEPTAGVDVTGQVELYRLIAAIRDREGCGVLLVSHNLHLVMAATDRVICLNRHVCCEGHPEAVTRHPAYLDLFGPEAAAALAVYSHRHDHRHDLAGVPVPGEGGGSGDEDRAAAPSRAPER